MTGDASEANLSKFHFTNPFVVVKDSMIAFFEWIGDLGIFCGRVFRAAFDPPHEGRELLRQIEAVGPKSFMLVALAGAATGAVLSLQTRDSLTRLGAASLLPSVIVFSLIKETGPIITGLILSGRVQWRPRPSTLTNSWR
jgi:phospholipid/cholesterol/gamma-HCH transport system permease protein